MAVASPTVEDLAGEIRGLRDELVQLENSVPASVLDPLRQLLAVPGNLLDAPVIDAVREPTDDPEQRAAMYAWLRWADSYIEALRGAVQAINGAGIRPQDVS